MMDLLTVCCLCGDVGFSDKLFRCSNCRYRSQHSYCSNNYSQYAEPIEVCDWCQCEEKNLSRQLGRSSAPRHNKANDVRLAYSGGKIKRHEGGTSAEKATGKTPSPRPPARRYKLLKDVMC